MPTPQQILALETKIAPAAVASEALTGVPAELSCAQCVIESGWLTTMPYQSNNPFGIKADAKSISGVLSWTHEWFSPKELHQFLMRGQGRTAQLDPSMAAAEVNGQNRYLVQDYFARYASLSDAFKAHAALLDSPRYQDALKQYQTAHDLAALIAAIAPVYATDPHYAETLGEIALSPEVTGIVAKLRVAVSGY